MTTVGVVGIWRGPRRATRYGYDFTAAQIENHLENPGVDLLVLVESGADEDSFEVNCDIVTIKRKSNRGWSYGAWSDAALQIEADTYYVWEDDYAPAHGYVDEVVPGANEYLSCLVLDNDRGYHSAVPHGAVGGELMGMVASRMQARNEMSDHAQVAFSEEVLKAGGTLGCLSGRFKSVLVNFGMRTVETGDGPVMFRPLWWDVMGKDVLPWVERCPPEISVVEPYWKRSRALRAQFDNYLKWYADKIDIEIIVVDDGSPTDPALPVIEEYRDKFACELRLIQMPIKQEGKDNCVVYNRGVAEARGYWVHLTQTDITHPEDILFGLQFLAHNLSLQRAARKFALYPCSMCRGRGNFRANQFLGCVAPDGVTMERSLYEEVGGFHEGYRDGYAVSDVDFALTLEREGVRRVVVADMIVMHEYIPSESWTHDADRWERNTELLKERFGLYHCFTIHPLLTKPGVAIRIKVGL